MFTIAKIAEEKNIPEKAEKNPNTKAHFYVLFYVYKNRLKYYSQILPIRGTYIYTCMEVYMYRETIIYGTAEKYVPKPYQKPLVPLPRDMGCEKRAIITAVAMGTPFSVFQDVIF